MTYHTVFDAGAPHTSAIWNATPGVLFMAIGVFLVLNLSLTTQFFRGPAGWARYFPWVMLVFATFWTAMVVIGSGNQESRIARAISTHDYRTVEGKVENFKPLQVDGHGLESFTVRGVPFSYSKYRITQGFNWSNGPVHEGLHVRIDYYNGLILKLEIADS